MIQDPIAVSDEAGPDFERLLGAGLDAFNAAAAGCGDRRPLYVIARDPDSNDIAGGISGRTSLGLAFLDLFYLPDRLRGAGLGSRLLAAFEDEARSRGCTAAVLYTINFQGPGFYAKNGWVSFGEVPSGCKGISRVFMSKVL